jgi:hypothetical protein
MADRGNGIRLFNDRENLEKIFEEFDESEDENEEEEGNEDGTAVITSQLRHFVIQVEYSNHHPFLDQCKESSPSRNTFLIHYLWIPLKCPFQDLLYQSFPTVER